MNCYKCELNLCTITLDCENNGTIDTGIVATETGNYTIELKFLNTTIKKTVLITSGQNIIFEMPFLNENYCYSFKIKLNNEYLDFNIDGTNYNSFNFCTNREWIIS